MTKEQRHRKHYARRERAARMIANGATVEAVCRKFRYSIYRLRDICKEFGLPSMAKVAREERHRGIVDALKRGSRRHEVAETFGVSTAFVGEIAQRYKIATGTDSRRRTITILAALINTTEPIREIARRHKFGRQWICQIASEARDAGIKLHPSRKTNHQPSSSRIPTISASAQAQR